MIALDATCCLHFSTDATSPDQDVGTGKIQRQPLLFGSAFKLQGRLGLPGAWYRGLSDKAEGETSRETEEHNYLTWPRAACRC